MKKKRNKLNTRLGDIRREAILHLFQQQYSAAEIGEVFFLDTTTVYNIIKTNKLNK